MKLRVYLDTSVFSAYYDERVPQRMVETEDFWKGLDRFELSISELTKEELAQTPDADKRQKLDKLAKPFTILAVNREMKDLAQMYLDANIFTAVMFNDALHVAVAVLERQDVLLSWNFKHLVNRRRRAMISEVNISKGLPTIEILAPPEI